MPYKRNPVPYRLDLLPPAALIAIGKRLKTGADRYGDNNWRECDLENAGDQSPLNHALAHGLAAQEHELGTGDRQEQLAALAVNAIFELQLDIDLDKSRTPSV